jgi:ankyrin repeat protein
MSLVLRIAVLAVLAFAVPIASGQQSGRNQTIDAIVELQRSIDFPMFRQRALPQLALAQARKLLTGIGKVSKFGEAWRPGNPYWERAEKILVADRRKALDPKPAVDPQEEKNYRNLLDELDDAQLEEVRRFYSSVPFRKSMRYADAILSTMGALTGRMVQPDDKLDVGDIERAMKELEPLKPTEAEEREFDTAFRQPALQILNRGAGERAMQAISNPNLFADPPYSNTTLVEVRAVLAEFRKAHGVVVLPPPAYEADFVFRPAQERAFRDLADRAMGGDADALARIRGAAESGDAVGQVELGRLYTIGRGVPNDPVESFAWTRRAASQGMPRAQFNLGVHYEQGFGVQRDLAQAASYYRRAAEAKFARAQHALGMLHRFGRGVPQDFQQSLEYFRAAADQLFPPAMLAMAEIYDVGAGVAKDEKLADEWLLKGRALNYSPAATYRDRRDKAKAEFTALIVNSPPSARASPTAVDKGELNRRLIEAVKASNTKYVQSLLDAGADLNARDVRPNEGETPLHHAARTGNVELAALLISKGADPNIAAPSGFTPLHVAAGLNRRAMLEFLLGRNANPNALDRRGTPLHAATLGGHAAIVALLLERGADPNSRDKSGNTPLSLLGHVSVYYPTHTEIIRRLAKAGADPFAIRGKGQFSSTAFAGAIRHNEESAIALVEALPALTSTNREAIPLAVGLAWSGYLNALRLLDSRGGPLDAAGGWHGDSALHAAAGAGHINVAEYLLSKGLQIDARAVDGTTPLSRAASNGFVEMVRFLLDRGANVEARNKYGMTPLMVSISSWREGKVPPLLVERKADIEARDSGGRSALDIALRSYSDGPTEFLLQAGADVTSKDGEGRTALHKVESRRGVERLLSLGVQVDILDNHGMSPLFHAAARTSEEVVNALLAAGASVKLIAKDGSRLVHHAAKGHTRILETLMDMGAGTVNDVDDLGRTPLHLAAQFGHSGTIGELIKRGAVVDARTAEKETPLHFAARSTRADSALTLLKAGADNGVRDRGGKTPSDIARELGNPWVIKAFEQSPISADRTK